MKFESKHGLGEICGYNEGATRGDKRMNDLLVKIISATFDLGGDIHYMVEHVTLSRGVQRFPATAAMLTGDPDYDQDAGCYPEYDCAADCDCKS